ncbi:MAG: hypothetical protein Q8K20_11400 [Gemmobacter sp.]|jgi:hypothetical protein|nr:hypothetical protein [Gemmobacter sp.]
MTPDRRWLKSVFAAAAQPLPALPWERAVRTPAPQAAPPRAAAVAAR